MIVKDIMAPFDLYQPVQLKDAFSLLESFGNDAWKMAGGYDSMDWFKDRIVRPKAVVDLTGIAEMKGIKETADGVEIGALTTLTEIENNPVIKSKYRLLANAVSPCRKPADPQQWDHGRQCFAECTLPLFPLWPALLPRGRHHLLRRYARRHQSRACAVRRGSLHGGVFF